MFGGTGNDTLSGGAGNDFLFNDLGSDRMAGGAGDDVFVLARSTTSLDLVSVDRIIDFTDGMDRLGLAEGLRFADLIIQQGRNIDGNPLNDTLIIFDFNGNDVFDIEDEFLAFLPNITPTLTEGADFLILT